MSLSSFFSSFVSTVYADAPAEEPEAKEEVAAEEVEEVAVEEEEEGEPEDVSSFCICLYNTLLHVLHTSSLCPS